MLEEHFEHTGDPEASHRHYAGDVVLEFPQSGERFEGLENLREWRSSYPASTKFEIDNVRGSGDVWVVELRVSYEDGPWHYGVSILEISDGRISRESIYLAEGWDPPEWRARWRAAP